MKRFAPLFVPLLALALTACSAEPPPVGTPPLAVDRGIPYGGCGNGYGTMQCTLADFNASMFASSGLFENGGCIENWCRAVLIEANQCGVYMDTVKCEKSKGVPGTAWCYSDGGFGGCW